MRRGQVPSRGSQPDATTRTSEQPKRKVFNCIVDDTALVAGVKKSTRDGIRKWISQGAIRLFVPLHTLTQLHRLKNGNERINADAREAVKWLDEVTSMPALEAANRVQLEGVEEQYTTWAEVEQFLLPDTLLSMEYSESEEEDYHEDLESSFTALDISDETSMSSTHSLEEGPKTPESHKSFSSNALKNSGHLRDQADLSMLRESPNRTARNSTEIARSQKSSKGAVPNYLQPLFNHILWRINKEENPGAALESFILLTNDNNKQAIAQKFGVRAKRLEQLRDAVAREDREFKNHLTIHKLEIESKVPNTKPSSPCKPVGQPVSSHKNDVKAEENSDDEDVVLFQRAPRGPAATSNNQRVLDPNEFGRSNQSTPPRGGRGGHPSPRGRGGANFRGRGAPAARGTYVAPGPVARNVPAPRHDPSQPIDPNSFTRPSVKSTPVRGANRRKLWEPN